MKKHLTNLLLIVIIILMPKDQKAEKAIQAAWQTYAHESRHVDFVEDSYAGYYDSHGAGSYEPASSINTSVNIEKVEIHIYPPAEPQENRDPVGKPGLRAREEIIPGLTF